jgi:hypothetical protein
MISSRAQLENSEYFNYFGSTITNYARCTREIKFRTAMAIAAINKMRTLFTSNLDLNLRNKLIKCYIWSIALYGAESWTPRKVDQKYLERSEMWCWMETFSCTDRVKNEKVLQSQEGQECPTYNKKKANWIGHILRRNCLPELVIEGKIEGNIEVMGRRGRTRKQLLDDLKETRG